MPKLGDGLPYLGGNGLIATARETMAIVFRAFSSPFLANRLSQHLLSRNWREVYQKPTRQGRGPKFTFGNGALGKIHKLRSAGLSLPLRRMTFASRQPFASR